MSQNKLPRSCEKQRRKMSKFATPRMTKDEGSDAVKTKN